MIQRLRGVDAQRDGNHLLCLAIAEGTEPSVMRRRGVTPGWCPAIRRGEGCCVKAPCLYIMPSLATEFHGGQFERGSEIETLALKLGVGGRRGGFLLLPKFNDQEGKIGGE